MVRAILEGRKTQTRRVVNVQPPEGAKLLVGHYFPTAVGRDGRQKPGSLRFGSWSEDCEWAKKSPFGEPGDELWVRETWRPLSEFDPSPETGAQYWADSHAGLEKRKGDANWRPAIHMPRWASRLTLTVTDVRVERLQEISEGDAIAEGCDGYYTPARVEFGEIIGPDGVCPQEHFKQLWQSIYGEDSWAANPWVWVVMFERKAVA